MSFQESFHKMDDMLRDPVYAKAVLECCGTGRACQDLVSNAGKLGCFEIE